MLLECVLTFRRDTVSFWKTNRKLIAYHNERLLIFSFLLEVVSGDVKRLKESMLRCESVIVVTEQPVGQVYRAVKIAIISARVDEGQLETPA